LASIEKVHRRRADEAGDEQVGRAVVEICGVPTCSTHAARITTTRSAIVIASTWSWVT
jgi:hypothetical protein